MKSGIAPKSLITVFKEPFRALKNRVFATLYFAESISLLGDAFTWVGLALLSYQFGKAQSAIILATALFKGKWTL
jgi:NRE family putative nickel resistance protein-like MFS transporter